MKIHLKRKGHEKLCPAAIIIREGHVLVGHRHYEEASVWTCPGGRCDLDESIEETLRREIFEETGIKKVEILKFLGEIEGSNKDDLVPLFLCKTPEEATLMEPEKFSEWRWVNKENFPQNFINKHAETIILNLL